jgi:hypothetical protein
LSFSQRVKESNIFARAVSLERGVPQDLKELLLEVIFLLTITGPVTFRRALQVKRDEKNFNNFIILIFFLVPSSKTPFILFSRVQVLFYVKLPVSYRT